MRSILLRLLPLLAALAIAGCGGDDDGGDKGSPAGRPTGGAGCIESFNADASPDVRGYTVAGVSEEDTVAGIYRGKQFDGSTESDPVVVKPGDCVVAQVTSTETEYVLVRSAAAGGPPTWHNLEDEGTPLAEPEAQLEEVARARLKGYGPEAKLEPKG